MVDAAQMTRTVDFGDIGKAAITAAAVDGSVTSNPLVFDLTKCPASTTDVGIRFDFTPDANHTNYLSNTGTGAGVLLGVTDENDNLEQSGGVVLATKLDKTAGTATDADIKVGNIASTVTISQHRLRQFPDCLNYIRF